jgi:hypothetical protein
MDLAACAEMIYLDLPSAEPGAPDRRARVPGRDLGLDH